MNLTVSSENDLPNNGPLLTVQSLFQSRSHRHLLLIVIRPYEASDTHFALQGLVPCTNLRTEALPYQFILNLLDNMFIYVHVIVYSMCIQKYIYIYIYINIHTHQISETYHPHPKLDKVQRIRDESAFFKISRIHHGTGGGNVDNTMNRR